MAPARRPRELSAKPTVTHEATPVATIAVGLAVAFLFGFAARLGLPPLVGYLVAGVTVAAGRPRLGEGS